MKMQTKAMQRLSSRLLVATATLLLVSNFLWAQETVDEGQRFIEMGQLAKVKGGGDGEGRFVLLDELGEVSSTLRPAANVELSQYLGEEVGVTARLLVDSDTPILLAESVTTFGKARQVSTDDYDAHVALAAHEGELLAQIAPTPISSNIPVIPGVPSTGLSVPHSISAYPVTEAPLVGGSPIMGGPPVMSGVPISNDYLSGSFADNYSVGGGSCGVGGCDSCGGGCGNTACKSCAACPCGLPGRWWIRGEYLLWWTKGMDTPPLLVSSPPGTSRRNAGVAGIAGNEVLFGGEEIFDTSRSGGRFRLGKWCDQCNWIGFEVDYFFLGNTDEDFSECNIGTEIVGRPFTGVTEGPISELIDFPGVAAGTAHIDAQSYLWSINPRLRVNLACERFQNCNPCDPCGVRGYRFDLLVGYRFMYMEDDLNIREQLMAPNDPTALVPRFDQVTFFDIRDSFSTSNRFNGADIGFLWEGYKGPWSLELIGKVGIGSTNQKVTIDGSTTRTANGNTFNDPGGLLALESNIGTYERDEFGVIPELDVTLGYALSARTRFLVGYSFIYWSSVVRAGEQIDTTINTDLLPDPIATTGPNRPEFQFVDTGFWAQGLSLGLEYRW